MKKNNSIIYLFSLSCVFEFINIFVYCKNLTIHNLVLLVAGTLSLLAFGTIVVLNKKDYDFEKNEKLLNILFLGGSIISLNAIVLACGLYVYNQISNKISSVKLFFIFIIEVLFISTWTLDLTKVLINYLISATPEEKKLVFNVLTGLKFGLAIYYAVLLSLKEKTLVKLGRVLKLTNWLLLPVSFTSFIGAIFSLKTLDVIEYELKAEKVELPEDVLLRMEDVDIGFYRGLSFFNVVPNLSLDIYKGETLGLVGESGSGKTTIGRAIVGINKVKKGKIIFHNKVINGPIPSKVKQEVKKGIQMVFQDPAASLNERTTVDYIISEGLRSFHLYENEKEREEKVIEAIKSVGLLPEHLSRYPHEFSGGQRQRIGIARAIVMKPELIIADEPISALDVSIRAQVLNLLKKFQDDYGLTYLFIAHDLSVVRFVADRIAVIYKGKIVELAPSDELFINPMHPYTKSLLSAVPQPNPQTERNKKIIKYIPDNVKGRELREIKKGHFVLATEDEISEYKKLLK